MASAQAEAASDPPAPAKGGRRRLLLVLIALPLLLAGAGAGLWFSGLLGAAPAAQAPAPAAAAAPAPRQPVFVAMPDITANLNAPGRRPAFIRLRSQIEVLGEQDAELVRAQLPRLVDLFTTYLRELRPEELRGSVGTHRLREELIARANIAAHPARVTDVLFLEILVQ